MVDRTYPPARYPTVVLAGGQARRMGGGDKPLLLLGGRTLLARVLARIAPQAGPIALSANGDAARLAAFGLPILADAPGDAAGPLAGVLAGLRWAARVAPAATHLLSVPGDTPFLPEDLVDRLRAALGGDAGRVACAASAGRLHPTVALWPLGAADALAAALAGGRHRVLAAAREIGLAVADFAPAADAGELGDPFFNVNTPADLAAAARALCGPPAARQGGEASYERAASSITSSMRRPPI